jgi:RNA polymerase sigma factor (sigma-70 family)
MEAKNFSLVFVLKRMICDREPEVPSANPNRKKKGERKMTAQERQVSYTHPDLSKLTFEEFYRTYRPYMKAVGRRMLDEHSLEEVVEDVALKLHRAGARLYNPSRGSILPYLGRMVRNRCIDRIRAARREDATEMDEIDREHAAWYGYEAASDELAARRELFGLVRLAVERLYGKVRISRNAKAYEMAYIMEMPPAVVARRLGMTVSGVHLAVFRCGAMMREILREMLS